MKFHQNPSSGIRVVPCGHTDGWTDGKVDMTQLIVAFRNFTNAPKNYKTGVHSVGVEFDRTVQSSNVTESLYVN